MIITIKSANHLKGDYGDYIEIVGVDSNGKDVSKNVSNRFKDKWDLLQENATVEIIMVQKDKKWYIEDIKPIAESLAKKVTEGIKIPETKSKDEVIRENMDTKAQEIRRDIAYKEIGEHIRTKTLTQCFGEDNAKILWDAYKDWVMKNL